MCWGFGVAEVHKSHSGFLNSVELMRSTELANRLQMQQQQQRARHGAGGEFKSDGADQPNSVILACMALLLCNNQVCDRDVFSAVVDSGLVFDGGLVVDTVCTNI